jgi:hypothetical protein
MATYLDGNVRKATTNTVKARRRSAESRRCPVCDRKSALKYDAERGAVYCRWSLETRVVTVHGIGGQSHVVGSRVISLCDYYKSLWEDS